MTGATIRWPISWATRCSSTRTATPLSAMRSCSSGRRNCSLTARATGVTSLRATMPPRRVILRRGSPSLPSTCCLIPKPPSGNSPTTGATRSRFHCLLSSRYCWRRARKALPWGFRQKSCRTTSVSSAMPPSATCTASRSAFTPTSSRAAASTCRATTTVCAAAT